MGIVGGLSSTATSTGAGFGALPFPYTTSVPPKIDTPQRAHSPAVDGHGLPSCIKSVTAFVATKLRKARIAFQ